MHLRYFLYRPTVFIFSIYRFQVDRLDETISNRPRSSSHIFRYGTFSVGSAIEYFIFENRSAEDLKHNYYLISYFTRVMVHASPLYL